MCVRKRQQWLGQHKEIKKYEGGARDWKSSDEEKVTSTQWTHSACPMNKLHKQPYANQRINTPFTRQNHPSLFLSFFYSILLAFFFYPFFPFSALANYRVSFSLIVSLFLELVQYCRPPAHSPKGPAAQTPLRAVLHRATLCTYWPRVFLYNTCHQHAYGDWSIYFSC